MRKIIMKKKIGQKRGNKTELRKISDDRNVSRKGYEKKDIKKIKGKSAK